MKNYSSEYAGIIAMMLTPVLGQYFSDGCAEELGTFISVSAVSIVVGIIMLVKRYQRGGVTPLGFRK